MLQAERRERDSQGVNVDPTIGPGVGDASPLARLVEPGQPSRRLALPMVRRSVDGRKRPHNCCISMQLLFLSHPLAPYYNPV